MPVSGNQQSGVKPPPSLLPSLNIAGVPIKKRRSIFPIKKRRFMWPPSPPPGERPLLPIESHRERDRRKLMEAGRSANVIKLGGSELSLSPNKAAVLAVGREREGQLTTDEVCRSDVSTVCGNPESSIGLKKHRISPLEDYRDCGTSQKHETGGPLSLNFSLSDGESSMQFKMNGVLSKTDNSNVVSNRSNWDLNTTMNVWEGSASDVAVGPLTAIGSNTVDLIHDMKTPACSTTVVERGYATEKQPLGVSECKSSISNLLSQSSEEYNSDDSLNLCVSALLSLSSSQGLSSSPGKKHSSPGKKHSSPGKKDRRGISNGSMPRGLQTVGKENVVSSRIKLEPRDESIKHDVRLAKPLQPSTMEPEFVVKSPSEDLKSSNFSSLKSGATSIKSEPCKDDNPERVKTTEGISYQSDEKDSQCQGTGSQNPCSTNELVLQDGDTGGHPTDLADTWVQQTQDVTVKPSSSTQLSTSAHSLDAEGASPCKKGLKEVCESAEHLASEVVSPSVDHCNNELNVSARRDTDHGITADNAGMCKLTSEEFLQDTQKNGECPVSDEEKVNLSGDMLEESSCSFDYECVGSSVPVDIEEEHGGQDDYEDGEIREPQLDAQVEDPTCEKGENSSHINSDGKKANSSGLSFDDHPTLSNAEQRDNNREGSVATNEDSFKESVDISVDGKIIEDAGKNVCVESLTAVGTMTGGFDAEKTIKTNQRNPLDMRRKDAFMDQGREQSSDQATSGGVEALLTSPDGLDRDGKTNDAEKSESALPKVEASLDGEDKGEDTHSGGNQSRIIKLSQASNLPSPGKTRSVSGRSVPSHPGRERLPDVSLECDKLDPRGRDELYSDSFHKFSRDRHQDQYSRNTRLNFVHGRGRIYGRIDTLRDSRDSGRDFINHNIGPDGSFFGNVRGSRKLLEDETSVFRHLSSRRRSPGGRDGPGSRGFPVSRRVPRNIDDGSEVGVSHNEKIMRGFPEDGAEHTFTRSQSQYEGLDGHFIPGNRSFSSVQRRGIPQIRSKSPARSRSPGPWSSTRRRSPDGFGGSQDLHHRRSPMYRMERMRSPDHPGFSRETVRRHGSPPYMSRSNDLRKMDPGNLRPIISNRSQTGRVFLRSNRRFVSDPRDRTDSDDLLGGPMHSGRFHELGSEGNGEERRRFGERRGPIRSFRSPFNADGGENFHLNPEDGRRPFRFLSDDADFHGRATLREREFDRRVKSRPGNAPRRPRGTEEQEGNYRQTGQVPYDDGFDDVSRLKRKRF